MTPFLKQVAEHYVSAPGLDRTCFIFPNRRSTVFFRKYLGESLAATPVQAMLCPPMYTINDFFYAVYGQEVTPLLRLLPELYRVYCSLNPKAEPLDEFIFWGEVILQDFDDIDKYLVDASSLFTNVSEFREIQGGLDYLSELQKEAVERFVSHFRDVHAGGKVMKERFLGIWNLLWPLYRDYNAALAAKGMSYEGMVYRSLAGRLVAGEAVMDILHGTFPEVDRYVFVGLNALNECEKTLLGKMRDASVAEFVWDFGGKLLTNELNKAGLFMRENIRLFPHSFELDPEPLPEPEIHVVSFASSVGQAKLAPEILSKAVPGRPEETAFVLPDENQLLPLLNSLPPEVNLVNVTMGCPMSGGSVYSLMKAVQAMQLRMRFHGGKWYFYHKNVSEIFCNTLFRTVLGEEELATVEKVKAAAKYYIPQDDLAGGEFLRLVFRPVVTNPKEVSSRVNREFADYLKSIVSYSGWMLRDKDGMLLELDYAKRYHTRLCMVAELELEVLPATFIRLLDQLVTSEAVPFRGEPLRGLQIMGPLETRALDFKNLVIMNANEGVFPRKSFSPSFIPPELRRGFGLPTAEYQDAVWAYYFYRMIRRSSKVWLLYDSRTEGLKTGEESRYIKQLQYHFGIDLHREYVGASMNVTKAQGDIPKTEEHVRTLKEGHLSASSLRQYLNCQAQFYYSTVCGLKQDEEVAESMDGRLLGDVFHKSMEQLYTPYRELTPQILESILKDRGKINDTIRANILELMHTIEVSGRDLVLEEIIRDYVRLTLEYDLRLLKENAVPRMKILGLERFMECHFGGFHFLGFVDRVDSYRDGEVRIVDYKTGRVTDEEVAITDSNAAAVVDKLFDPASKKRPGIAMQLFIYDLFAENYPDLRGKTVVNAIYSPSHLFNEPLEEKAGSPVFHSLMKERLAELLDGLCDTSVPFRRTENLDMCKWCDFKNICGR